jgi:glycosyltransferase involved in cell wall biosynthesis
MMSRRYVADFSFGAGESRPAKISSSDVATKTPSRVWTISGDFFALQPTGVVRYAREVTLALDALIAERHPLTENLQIEILAPLKPDEKLELHKIQVRIVPEFNRPRLPQFWVQAQLPFHVEGGLLSFCNLAPVLVRRHIVCIHDLQTRIAPESYGRLFRWAHRAMLPILGRTASAVTTVSALSREHLVRFRVAPREKIVVTYNGSDHVTRWRAARSDLDLSNMRPFVLCLGRSQRHKNVELLVRLAPLLDEIGVDICMAGEIDQDTLERYCSDEPANVRLVGRISDDDFAKALSTALCFVFPSRTEGFGLPAVEAMALGCPVIASRAPCLPEICGDAALYADPDDAAGWISAIHRLQTDGRLRSHMIAKGYARARAYSWRTIAKTYLNLMACIDAGDRIAIEDTGRARGRNNDCGHKVLWHHRLR